MPSRMHSRQRGSFSGALADIDVQAGRRRLRVLWVAAAFASRLRVHLILSCPHLAQTAGLAVGRALQAACRESFLADGGPHMVVRIATCPESARHAWHGRT